MIRITAFFFLVLLLTSSSAFGEGPDRTKLPGPSGETQWAIPNVEQWSLKNGIQIWLLEQDQAPLISMRLITSHGAGTDPAEKAGLAALMVDMLDEGAGSYDALSLSDAFQMLATDYRAGATDNGLSFSLEMLVDNLVPSLELLKQILRNPTLPEQEFKRLKAQRLAAALADEAELISGASRVRKRALFGQGYGGHAAGGVRGTLEKISYEDIKGQYKALVQPEGATIVVVGNITKSKLNEALEAKLGDWVGKATAPDRPLEAQKEIPAVHFVDFPGSAQSVVMMARPAPADGAADHFPALVFNRPFSGSFTGRVNMNLREDKGYSYGARGAFARNRHAGAFIVYAKVKGDTTRASIDEMIKELSDIRGERPLSAQEIQEAKSGLRKSFPGRFEQMSHVANMLQDLALSGRSPDWYQNWPEKVKAVDLATAQATAQVYTAPESFAIVVAGDWSKIGESIKGLNRPIVTYDAQGNRMKTPGPEKTESIDEKAKKVKKKKTKRPKKTRK